MDQRTIARISASAAQVTSWKELAEHTLPLIAGATAASQSLLFRTTEAQPFDVFGGSFAQHVPRYMASGFAAQDPVMALNFTAPNAPLVDGATCGTEGTGVHGFYAALDMTYHLGFRPRELLFGTPGMAAIYLTRSQQSGPWPAPIKRALRSLVPSIRAAMARSDKFAALELRALGYAALCESAIGAHAIWASDGTLVGSSRDGEVMLAPRDVRHELSASARAYARDGAHATVRTRDVQAHFFLLPQDDRPALVGAWLEHGRQHAQLTPAESRVHAALCEGLSNKEIAQALGIAFDTVRTHVKQILAKLGVDSRLQAARVGWRDQPGLRKDEEPSLRTYLVASLK